MKRSLGNKLEVKKNRLKRRRRRIVREITLALTAVGASAVLGLVMMYGYNFALCSDYFRLEETTVKGTVRLSEEEVRRLSGAGPETNILVANMDSMVAGIKANPWVREVRMTRALPSRLVIEIVEREPLALIRHDRNLYLLDKEGTIFKNLDQDDPVDFPIMTGFSDDGSLDEALVRGALDLINHLERRNTYPEMRHISEIRGDHLRGYSICTVDHRLYVLGAGDYESKFRRLRSILFDLAAGNSQLSPLMVDLTDPGRVVVRQGGSSASPALQEKARRTDL